MTTDTDTPAFEGWAILELMGHRRLAGHLGEQQVAGAAFLRLDIPDGDGPGLTQLYAPAAVYAITPTTEEIARAVAAHTMSPAPVSRCELPAAPTVPTCRICRCSGDKPCEGDTDWVTADLCQTCAPLGECEVCPRPATQRVGRLGLCGVLDVEHPLSVDEDRRAELAGQSDGAPF
jgi:hypothetical protein